MNILVTGGAGYIGSHAVKALARAGFHPVTIDDGSTGHTELIRWGDVVTSDLVRSDALVSLLREYDIEGVMHFAGRSLVAESHGRPDLYYRVNIAGTLKLLQAMVSAGVGLLLYSSSAAIYGTPRENPISEESPCVPISPYGETKLAAERMIEWYAGLRAQGDLAPVLQRRRGRPRGGARGMARTGDPSYPALGDRRAERSLRCRCLWNGLSHTGWDLHP